MTRALLLLFLACSVSGCVRTAPPAMSPAGTTACRAGSLRWFAPEDAQHRARLDTWCAGVGAPAVERLTIASDAESVDIRNVAFVSWNVHVGNGDIRAFVTDLRAGNLTKGRAVRHFVLLLQEAVRSEGVPPYSAAAAGAGRIAAHDSSQDIVRVSRDLGLALIYVPSMRNGNSPSDPPTDRGSAILSTLPLQRPVAVELPGERQRRVAIIASVAQLSSAAGAPLSVGVIHLDALGSPRRLWVFSTASMRETQVRAVAPLLPTGPLVLGADLNTWHGEDEGAARFLSRVFGSTPVSLERQGFALRVLDYLFFRHTEQRSARYQQAVQHYGSDHRPLIGWIE